MDPNPTPGEGVVKPDPIPRPESGVLTPYTIGAVFDPEDLALRASCLTR